MFWVIFGILFGVSGCLFYMYFRDKLRLTNERITTCSDDIYKDIDDIYKYIDTESNSLTIRIDDEIRSVYEKMNTDNRKIKTMVQELSKDMLECFSKSKLEFEKNNDEVQNRLNKMCEDVDEFEIKIKALLDSRLDRMYNKIIYTVTASSNDRDVRFSDKQ